MLDFFFRRLGFSSDADNVRLTNVCIVIIIIILTVHDVSF